MKITIDTKEDSREDILRVIKMLQSLVGSESVSESYTNQGNIFEQPNPELPMASVLGEFLSNKSQEPEKPEAKQTQSVKIEEYY